MTRLVTVTAPFDVYEVVQLFHLFGRERFVFGVPAAIPTGPDGRRVNIDDIAAEITTSNRSLTRRIQTVSKVVQFSHEGANLVFVNLFKVTRQVVLVAQGPEDDRRVVLMLVDHVHQHAAR